MSWKRGDSSAEVLILYAFLSASPGVTEWDLAERRLEHAGGIADEVALPTAQDLAAGRDPVWRTQSRRWE